MKFIVLLFTFAITEFYFTEALQCGEVSCPPAANTCALKYLTVPRNRQKITTVTCFDVNHRIVAKESYTEPLDEQEYPLPVVECGGHRCNPGAYNCTTISTPYIKRTPPVEETHLTCRDDGGIILEERDIVRNLTLKEATGETPPTCEGYSCPKGSRSCSYDTIIQLDPYSKTTHVVCYNIKNKITSDVRLKGENDKNQ